MVINETLTIIYLTNNFQFTSLKVCHLSLTCKSPDTKVQKSELVSDGRDRQMKKFQSNLKWISSKGLIIN